MSATAMLQGARYRVTRTLHRGERSHVYTAWDSYLRREVVLKRSANAAREHARLGACAACDPRRVVKLVDRRIATDDDIDYGTEHAVMAARVAADLGGVSSSAVVMEKHGACMRVGASARDDRAIARVMRPLAAALVELYERSEVYAHCDVKFNNYVHHATDGPEFKVLIDLELAASRGAGGAARRCVRGTPAYMSPEMWAQSGVSETTDSWSLGIMAYQLAHGEEGHPFEAVSPGCLRDRTSLIHAMRTYTFDPNHMWRNGEAIRMKSVVCRLLDPDYRNRLTPREFMDCCK